MSDWGGPSSVKLAPPARWVRDTHRTWEQLVAGANENPCCIVERLNDGTCRGEWRARGLRILRVSAGEPPDHCAIHRPEWVQPGVGQSNPHRPDPRVVQTWLYQWRRE